MKKLLSAVVAVVMMCGGLFLTSCGDKSDNSQPESDASSVAASSKTNMAKKFASIPYTENAMKYQYLDVELPEGEGPFPVVMFIHGGAWMLLNRKYDLLNQTFESFLSKGYAIVRVDYTLTDGNVGTLNITKSGYPNMIYDLKAAVRFLRANAKEYNLDTNNIAALGESAGAHLAMLLGTTNGNAAYEDLSMGNGDYSSDIQAIVSYYGPADLNAGTKNSNDLATCVLGNDSTEAQRIEASPYYQLSKNSPPLFLTHGRNDESVAFENSTKMEQKAKELIGEDNVTTVYFDNAPHADKVVFNGTELISSIETFLSIHLNNPPLE